MSYVILDGRVIRVGQLFGCWVIFDIESIVIVIGQFLCIPLFLQGFPCIYNSIPLFPTTLTPIHLMLQGGISRFPFS